MEKMKIAESDPNGFVLNSRGAYPAICIITGLHFHDTDPVCSLDIDWVCKGRYTNGQRKKLVARTIRSLLQAIVADERKKSHIHKGTQ